VAREPIINAPPAVGRMITALVLVYIIQWLLQEFAPGLADWLIAVAAFNSARYAELPEGAGVFMQMADGTRVAMETRFPGEPLTNVTTIVTYGFLHGGWVHLGFNCIWLLAFGTPVARYLGELRFYCFMVAAMIAGAVAFYFFNMTNPGYMIGASGAVSGLMGAAIRVLFAPVHVVFRDGRMVGANRQGLASFSDNRLIGFAAVWILLNLGLGLASQNGPTAIAWEAHLGGFVFGLFGFRFFLPKR